MIVVVGIIAAIAIAGLVRAPEGHLRHAAFLGLRSDKLAKHVRRDT